MAETRTEYDSAGYPHKVRAETGGGEPRRVLIVNDTTPIQKAIISKLGEPSRGAPDARTCECGKPVRHAGRCKGRKNGGANTDYGNSQARIQQLLGERTALLEALKRPADDWETECPRSEDKQHCTCWYDGKPCCRCRERHSEQQCAPLTSGE